MSWFDPVRSFFGNTTQQQVNEEEERLAEQRRRNEKERREEQERQREQQEYYERQERRKREEARMQREENSRKEKELKEELRKLKEKNDQEIEKLEEEGRKERSRISEEKEEERKAMDKKYVEKVRELKKKHEGYIEKKLREIEKEKKAYEEKEKVIDEEIMELHNERMKNTEKYERNTREQFERASEAYREELENGHVQTMAALRESHQVQIETSQLRIEERIDVGRQLMSYLNEESNRNMRNLSLELTNHTVSYQKQLAQVTQYSDDPESLEECLQEMRTKKELVRRSCEKIRREMNLYSCCSPEIKDNVLTWLEGLEDVHAAGNELCDKLKNCLMDSPEVIKELCQQIGTVASKLQNAQNNLKIEN